MPPTRQFHFDALLTITIAHCAGRLDPLGAHLLPLALIVERLVPPLTFNPAVSGNGCHN
jgi:hypothetical protein